VCAESRRVETLVVGGGLNGWGVAYYLAREGLTDTLVVEADENGSGATAGSMGNVRQQFGTALEIECSRRGLEFWKTLEEQFGMPIPFHEDGYLMLTGQASTAALLEEHAELQRSLGMPNVHILTPDQVRDVAPFIDTEGLICGSWTPEDGHVMPTDGMTAFLQAARGLGVSFRQHWPVERIERGPDGWHVFGPGEIVAERVVVVAGAGTKELLKPFDIDLDIYPAEHYAVVTEPAYSGSKVPTTIDLDTGMAVEREGESLMLAMLARNPAARSHDHLVELFVDAASVRAPVLMDLKIVHQLSAFPTLGGDGHPYVGQVDDNLWALAFTGHGAMHGPPVAEALARLVVGRPDRTLDLSPWDIRRTPGERTVLWRRDATS
jgi:sarcosine oxidase subunit beta